MSGQLDSQLAGGQLADEKLANGKLAGKRVAFLIANEGVEQVELVEPSNVRADNPSSSRRKPEPPKRSIISTRQTRSAST